jgi:hypothetical protein
VIVSKPRNLVSITVAMARVAIANVVIISADYIGVIAAEDGDTARHAPAE